MTDTLHHLRTRTDAALALVRATRPVLAELDIKVDERTATALPLALAAMDTAEAICTLLLQQPERYWVAALMMQRSQMEYGLRAAFFAKAASQRELMAFRRTGSIPSAHTGPPDAPAHSLRAGTIVDATIIHAPSSTKNAEKKRDPEMHQTRKGNQWYFGMKAHIGVDEFSGLVHHATCTAADVADVTMTHALLH